MTDQPNQRTPDEAAGSAAGSDMPPEPAGPTGAGAWSAADTTPGPGTTGRAAAASGGPISSFDWKALDDRGKALGKEAEAATQRFARDPGLVRAADVASFAWGALLFVIGVWFVADVTLGLDLPTFPWSEAWPIALIVLGLGVVASGAGRRRR